MKYRFTNATISERKKGDEVLAPPTQVHPAREIVISSEHALPVIVKKRELSIAKPLIDPLDEMKKEVARALAEKQKAKKEVPRSRVLSMAHSAPTPEPLMKEYADVLAMLLGKK